MFSHFSLPYSSHTCFTRCGSSQRFCYNCNKKAWNPCSLTTLKGGSVLRNPPNEWWMQPQRRPGVQGFTRTAACDPKDRTPNLDYTGVLCPLTYVAKSQQHKGCISPLEPQPPRCCSRMQWVVEDTYTLWCLSPVMLFQKASCVCSLVYTIGDRTHSSLSRLVLCKYFYIPEKNALGKTSRTILRVVWMGWR